MNVKQQIESSRVCLGGGSCRQLTPVITKKGVAAGWSYDYPVMLNLNGVNFSKLTTLDAMLADGVIELKEQVITLI
jgi:hypothetical protein